MGTAGAERAISRGIRLAGLFSASPGGRFGAQITAPRLLFYGYFYVYRRGARPDRDRGRDFSAPMDAMSALFSGPRLSFPCLRIDCS